MRSRLDLRGLAALTGGVPPAMSEPWPSTFRLSLEPHYRSLPLLALLCGLFPERREWYQHDWCRRAQSDAQVWDDTRATLDLLLGEGRSPPWCLRRFAMLPRPRGRRGNRRQDSRDLRFAYLHDAFLREGFTLDELWETYRRAIPPKPGLRDARDSFRDLCKRAQKIGWLIKDEGSFEELAPFAFEVPPLPELTSGDADHAVTVRELLAGPWPGLAFASRHWELPDKWRVIRWCHLAEERGNGWLWDELRAWLDWLVYSDLPIPPTLPGVLHCPRPRNEAHRLSESSLQFRAALVADRLEELGHSTRGAVQVLAQSWPHSVEDSTVRRHLISGRDLIRELTRGPFGPTRLPWPHPKSTAEGPMELRRFDPDRYYRPTDPELGPIGTPGSLAHRRYRGAGPRWVSWGNRVFYKGEHLNEFLDAHVVALPGDEPDGPASASGGPVPPGSSSQDPETVATAA